MATHLPLLHFNTPSKFTQAHQRLPFSTPKWARVVQIRAAVGTNGGSDSYLGMWKKARERREKEAGFLNLPRVDNSNDVVEESPEVLERKSHKFQKILQVSKEERDRVQRLQVIDPAAAAIAAARAVLKDKKPTAKAKLKAKQRSEAEGGRISGVVSESGSDVSSQIVDGGLNRGILNNTQSRASGNEPPGPDFWSWTPPPEDDPVHYDVSNAQKAPKTAGNVLPTPDVLKKERCADTLSLPLESKLSQNDSIQSLPPFQSLLEVHKVDTPNTSQESITLKDDIDVQFSAHAAEAADALHDIDEKPSYMINPDGSRMWRESGVERRAHGVVCRWTLNRGVTADGVVEWEEKYWEAADNFNYKELGSEKSGRDAMGNVWREYWKESMWQELGLLHMEKTADKWGKNGKGDEWQERWWEQYDASGKADKWAHKWCSIDPNTQVEAGHAHVWHERWGEKYDGQGGSTKYTDKWAERFEGDAWVKWGDKWDEHFDLNTHGVKQGETWWEGKYGDRWNRTWGERHNGSGWVHKYGKSSSGEHWDTHLQEDTWYEKYPHFGFMHCFENSVQLREVNKPSETS